MWNEVGCVELRGGGGGGGGGGVIVVFLLHVGIGAFNTKDKWNCKNNQ